MHFRVPSDSERQVLRQDGFVALFGLGDLVQDMGQRRGRAGQALDIHQ